MMLDDGCKTVLPVHESCNFPMSLNYWFPQISLLHLIILL